MSPKLFSRIWILITFTLFLFPVSTAYPACRNPNVAGDSPFVTYAAAKGPVEIKWFGHAFFQITSSIGTKIITDPFGSMGFPMPEVWADVVTVGREHGNHNNVGLVKGKPVVLRGLKEGGNEWDDVNLTYKDVLIYNVPVHQRGVPEYATTLKGAAFVFEVDLSRIHPQLQDKLVLELVNGAREGQVDARPEVAVRALRRRCSSK